MKREIYPATITAAASYVPCSPNTLINYERAGIVVPTRDSAGRRLYVDQDVQDARRYRAKLRRKQ